MASTKAVVSTITSRAFSHRSEEVPDDANPAPGLPPQAEPYACVAAQAQDLSRAADMNA